MSAHYPFSDAQVQDGVIQTYPCRYAVIEVGPKSLSLVTKGLDAPDIVARARQARTA